MLIFGIVAVVLFALTACGGVAQGFGLRGTQVTDAMLCPDQSKRTNGPVTVVDMWWPFETVDQLAAGVQLRAPRHRGQHLGERPGR